MTSSEQMPDHTKMQCLHRYRSWWLFNVDNQPRVLHRYHAKSKDSRGIMRSRLVEEWGALTGDHITDAASAVLTQAWKEWTDWRGSQVAP